MNVLDTNTPLPDLIKAMEDDPHALYNAGDGRYELFNIEPALRFVLSYWANPRPLTPWHIASLAIQLSETNVYSPYEEEEALLQKHVRAMGAEFEALYKRQKEAKEFSFA